MMDEFDLFKDFLLQHKLRWTPQRKMILDVFYPSKVMYKSNRSIKKFENKIHPLESQPYIEP